LSKEFQSTGACWVKDLPVTWRHSELKDVEG